MGVLDMIGFSSLFEIYSDLQQAVTSFPRSLLQWNPAFHKNFPLISNTKWLPTGRFL